MEYASAVGARPAPPSRFLRSLLCLVLREDCGRNGCGYLPTIEYKDGKPREKNKYLSPPGEGNKLYFVPGTVPEWLLDSTLPVVITEGEKKTLSLWELAHYGLSDAVELPIPSDWPFRRMEFSVNDWQDRRPGW